MSTPYRFVFKAVGDNAAYIRYIDCCYIHAVRTAIIYDPERRSGVYLRILTMQNIRSFSLSDFIRDPDSVIEDLDDIPDDDIEYVKEYGI